MVSSKRPVAIVVKQCKIYAPAEGPSHLLRNASKAVGHSLALSPMAW